MPIFGSKVVICVCDSIIDELEKKENIVLFSGKYQFEGDVSGCYVHSDTNVHMVLFNVSDLSVEVISHEIVHLTYGILRYNECETENNEEIFALLNGFLSEKIFKEFDIS